MLKCINESDLKQMFLEHEVLKIKPGLPLPLVITQLQELNNMVTPKGTNKNRSIALSVFSQNINVVVTLNKL